jgi:hypothetical protein
MYVCVYVYMIIAESSEEKRFHDNRWFSTHTHTHIRGKSAANKKPEAKAAKGSDTQKESVVAKYVPPHLREKLGPAVPELLKKVCVCVCVCVCMYACMCPSI